MLIFVLCKQYSISSKYNKKSSDWGISSSKLHSGNGFVLAQLLADVIAQNSALEVISFEIKLNKDEPWSEQISFSIDQKELKNSYIVLIDDVVNSGKTMQYALLKFLEQATKAIKTVALIDRQHRRYPIKTDFAGLSLSTTLKNHVEVDLSPTDAKVFLY